MKAKWDQGSSICPMCKRTDDQHHFLRCPHTQHWRNQLLRDLRHKLEQLQTNYVLQRIILDAISAFFKQRTINPDNYPKYVKQMIHKQVQIGWTSFIRGFWAQEWLQLQRAHLRRHHITDHTLHETIWASNLIKFLWKAAYEAWELHNNSIHGISNETKDNDARTRIINKVRSLHELKPRTLEADKDLLFFTDLDNELPRMSTRQMRNWINLYRPAIHESIRRRSQMAIENTKPLTCYFPIILPQSKRPPKPRDSKKEHTLHDAQSKKR